MTVLLDLDGVLADFVAGACARHSFDPADIDWDTCGWGIHEGLGLTEDAFWAALDADPFDFWANLPVYPWTEAVVDLVLGLTDDVYLCTTPSRHPQSLAGKVAWIQRHLPKALQRRYVLTPHKHLLARPGVVLIDDGPHNVDPFVAAGGAAVLFPGLWNDNAAHAADPIRFLTEALYGHAPVSKAA